MNRRFFLGIGLLVTAAQLTIAQETINEQELLRRTQELFDSLVTGNKEPWQKYYADDAIFFDEKEQIIATQVLRYYEDPAVGKTDPNRLSAFVGTYQLGPDQVRTVTSENGKLFVERKGKKEELVPETSDIFFRKGVEGRILFRSDDKGAIDALIDRRNNEDVIWRKVK